MFPPSVFFFFLGGGCLLSIVCIIWSSDKRVVSAGHVYYIQITQYRIQQRLPKIFLSVVSKKLRSRIWTGIVGSLSLGYQFKFPKVSKVCFAYDCLYSTPTLLHRFLSPLSQLKSTKLYSKKSWGWLYGFSGISVKDQIHS